MFKIKGGNSDIAWENEMDPIDIPPPDGGDPDPGDDPGDDWGDDPWDNEWDEDWDEDWGGGYDPGDTNPPPEDNNPTTDFKRDNNGKIISRNTGNTTNNSNYPGVTLIMSEHIITTKDGTEITVYKVDLVFDQSINELREPTDAEKANCFGLAFLDGDFWLGIDNTNTSSIDESYSLETTLDTLYALCSPEEADVVVVSHGGLDYHAGIINDDGTITAKGGTAESETYDSIEDFRGDNYTDGVLKYYKKK